LHGYFECEPEEGVAIMEALYHATSRDVLSAFTGIPASDLRTVFYPRHMHSMALIDYLIDQGYKGARYGASGNYATFGSGDYSVPPENSWDEGISLYRVPIACYTQDIVGDHSAETPEYFSHELFLERMTWRVEEAVENGGMLIVYTHHLGDNDDSYGNVNYGSGGLTVEELGWIIDLVNQYDGAIMTFSDAVDYYRSKSDMVEIDGDYVWVAREQGTSVVVSSPRSIAVSPNPFNPSTQITWSGFSSGTTTVSIYDTKGRLVAQSHDHDDSFNWSGLDLNGQRVSSGTYIARVSDGLNKETATITLVP